MARTRSRICQAAATHRQAAAIATAANITLTGYVPRPRTPSQQQQLQQLTERLRTAAGQLAPDWLGTDLAAAHAPPLGTDAAPAFLRVGTARLPADAEFPVVVPLGHVAMTAEPGDPRPADALQAMLLRLLATAPAGTLLVKVVDPDQVVWPPFATLCNAGLMSPPITDHQGLITTLAEAEQWRYQPGGPRRVLVIAGWPHGTTAADAARVARLASRGQAVHLLIADWPPADLAELPLPGATCITLGQPYATVGHPPGGSFAAGAPPGLAPSSGLNAEVTLDAAPATPVLAHVCEQLVAQAMDHAKVHLGELLPEGAMWQDDPSSGPSVAIGRAGAAPVALRLGEPTRHWLIGGRARSGKTTLLHNILYGLSSRFDPDQLAVYLLDPGGATDRLPASFTELAAELTHVRAAGLGTANRVRAVLQKVAADVAHRHGPRHTVCLIDRWDELADDPALTQLRALASSEPERGIHLVLAGETIPDPTLAAQCRGRVALAGAQVLDSANDAAAALALGSAIVNTASGLGGPRGATRAHEQRVQLPDPYADAVALAGLRHRLLQAGGAR